MRIKRLDIHGFKSFVDKTTLQFPMGVTAIVGPNGCGKSNIVDAIRWVLGEHNARHLRGKNMEDVIFNGSEIRKSLGMAEVVLTLSNEEGLAPVRYADFTEIEVARRLYRSGESEYYINKVQCRLKDVVDLFTDTGIGTRAYSIIEQGRIDWLVNARPEDRRLIFEEAAGINKYKQRKEAALRRVESTRQNLVRVNDIIGEIKRQLNSLNRQAKKAERYKAVKEELRHIELLLASEEHTELNRENHDFKKKQDDIRTKIIELTTSVADKEALLEGARSRYLDEERALKDIRERTFNLKDSLHSKERDIELAIVRTQELERLEGRLLQEITELKGQKDSAAMEIGRMREEATKFSSVMEDTARSLQDSEGSLRTISRDLQSGDERLKGQKAELLDTLTNVSHLKNKVQGYLRDEDMLHLKKGKAGREREDVEKAILERETSLKQVSDDIEKLRLLKKDVDRKGVDTQVVLENLEDELMRKEDSIRQIKEELTLLSSRLSTLNDLQKNFDGFRDGVRSVMKSVGVKEGSAYEEDKGAGLQKDFLHGIHGVFADFIETKQDYEKAVEAALGEKLQYIVVENQKDGIEAVEYLKTHSFGKGSFVPLKIDKEGYNSAAVETIDTENEGSSNNGNELINHVVVKNGYLHIAKQLLGDVSLVNNLDEAIDIWRKNTIKKTLVTPEGELINRYGIISGGSSGGQEGGILQKKREIKEISHLVEELRLSLRRAEVEKNRMIERVSGKRSILDKSKAEAHSKALELVNIEAKQRGDKEELERLRGRLGVLDFEINEVEAELAEISREKAELIKERDSTEIKQKETEESINLLSEEIDRLSIEKENAVRIVTDAKISLASSGERIEAIKGRLASKEGLLHDLEMKLENRFKEKEDGEKEVYELKSKGSILKEELEKLLSDKDELRSEEIVKEEAINSTSQNIGELDNSLGYLKKEVSRMEEEKNRFELSMKEMELKLLHLFEKIDEKYGIAINIYEPSQEIKDMNRDDIHTRCDELRTRINEFGEVNLSALDEYTELENRHQFLTTQQEDLTGSIETLQRTINRINRTTRERFRETFDEINLKFRDLFPRFFMGGKAELRLLDDGNLLESGIDIVAQPPGKRLQGINLLSGGEKALTAASLIFSIFMIKPSPFCLLDEVDAPLDDVNTNRFDSLLREMSERSQFVLVTHNKHTMETADTLFGVTMEEPGISKIVSVQLN
ncbi:MAG: chromosome segregation protein SMC [Thermodesulfobacteriota bacterium]